MGCTQETGKFPLNDNACKNYGILSNNFQDEWRDESVDAKVNVAQAWDLGPWAPKGPLLKGTPKPQTEQQHLHQAWKNSNIYGNMHCTEQSAPCSWAGSLKHLVVNTPNTKLIVRNISCSLGLWTFNGPRTSGPKGGPLLGQGLPNNLSRREYYQCMHSQSCQGQWRSIDRARPLGRQMREADYYQKRRRPILR